MLREMKKIKHRDEIKKKKKRKGDRVSFSNKVSYELRTERLCTPKMSVS